MSLSPQDSIPIWIDIFGTGSFAFSGALRVLDRKPDFIGMLILATATSLGGAILRDAIIGRPCMAFQIQGYPLVIVASVLITFCFPRSILQNQNLFRYFDAVGTGTFAAITANVAYVRGYDPLAIILIATIAGPAGGVVRDLIIQKPTIILSNELIVTPIIFGVLGLLLVRYFGGSEYLGFFAATAIGCGVRLGAIIFDWRLPRVLLLNTSEE